MVVQLPAIDVARTAPVRRREWRKERSRARIQHALRLWDQPDPITRAWVYTQAANTARHAAGLKPIAKGEFGAGPAAPSESHRQAVNALLAPLQKRLFVGSRRMMAARGRLLRNIDYPELYEFLVYKDRNQALTQAIERIWEFYHELFLQRKTRFADQLLACDRIGRDCYQAVYTKLGKPRSIPSPAPFSYMESTRAPATFRRFVRVSRILKLPNPFPLVKLPRRRLMNPWSLGAIPHEICHGIQSDLGMWLTIPRAIARRLVEEGLPRSVTRIWVRWSKELFADLAGQLMTGPAFVASLIDLLSRTPKRVVRFSPRAVHPVPYLRVFINLELLKRTGFELEAAAYRKLWSRLYPRQLANAIPQELRQTFSLASRQVVDTVCFTPYSQLGDKALADVVQFTQQDQALARQAARRLAAGVDPGIVPERFLIAAARIALDNRLARPGVISNNFYRALVRR